jgi:hypothetical protein
MFLDDAMGKKYFVLTMPDVSCSAHCLGSLAGVFPQTMCPRWGVLTVSYSKAGA